MTSTPANNAGPLKAGDLVRHKITGELGTVLANHGYRGVEVTFDGVDRMTKRDRLARYVPTKPAAELAAGDVVIVTDSLARYHRRPELAGQARTVVSVVDYGRGTLGVTVDGLPETGIAADTAVELPR